MILFGESTINGFTGEYRWLSNFYPCKVFLDGVEYPTVEHAYVAAKCADEYDRQVVRKIEKPGYVKNFGRGIQKRHDWDSIRIVTMLNLLRQKFSQDYFRQKLLETGSSYIEETNHWGDTFWGVCDGKGDNRLGYLLMNIRTEINEEAKTDLTMAETTGD